LLQQPPVQLLPAQQASPTVPQARQVCEVMLQVVPGAVHNTALQQPWFRAPQVPQLPMSQLPRPRPQALPGAWQVALTQQPGPLAVESGQPFCAQQGSVSPPQAWQVLARQMVPVAEQVCPRQQGSVAAPQCSQVPLTAPLQT